MTEEVSGLVQAAIIPVAVGIAVWWFQSQMSTIKTQRQRLHDERRQLYVDILEPYMAIFSGGDDKLANVQQAVESITSSEYKATTFQLMMLGSDEVVNALNDMMQYFYKQSDHPEREAQPLEALKRWGALLLAIRRDLGNKNTKLQDIDMLRAYITDIDTAISEAAY